MEKHYILLFSKFKDNDATLKKTSNKIVKK